MGRAENAATEPFFFALAASAALVGCSANDHADARVATLVVEGPQESLERFANLQGSRRPALLVSEFTDLGEGRFEAAVALPKDFSDNDLVHTTREAVAAGLSYELVIVR